MKLPRNIDGDEPRQPAFPLRISCHSPVRQPSAPFIGERGTHDLTIPRHKPLRVGTLHGILKDVAHQQAISREQVIADLFG